MNSAQAREQLKTTFRVIFILKQAYSTTRWPKTLAQKIAITLIHSNIFRLRLFRAFFDAWFAQNKVLIELNSPISAVHLSFATIFNTLISFDFAHIPDLNFPMNVVYNGEKRFALFKVVFEKTDVDVRVRIRPNDKFFLAVAVYSPRASSFALIWLVFKFTSYILTSNFQFKLQHLSSKI